jgi:hypothetical protein
MHKRRTRLISLMAIVCSASLTSGCSTLSGWTGGWLPGAGVDTAVTPITQYNQYDSVDLKDPTTVPPLMEAVKKEYGNREQSADRLGADSLVPIAIGAAVAIGAAAFIHGPAQTNALKGVGLGTGLYEALNQIYSPSSHGDAYDRGIKAVTCVSSAAQSLFTSHSNLATLAQLAAMQTASGEVTQADAVVTKNSIAGPASSSAADVAAYAALTQAKGAADAALPVAQAELGASENASSIVLNAITSINELIRTLLRPQTTDAAGFTKIIQDSITQSTSLAPKQSQAANANTAAGASRLAARSVPGPAPSPTDPIEQATNLYNSAANTINTSKPGLADAQAAVSKCVASF